MHFRTPKASIKQTEIQTNQVNWIKGERLKPKHPDTPQSFKIVLVIQKMHEEKSFQVPTRPEFKPQYNYPNCHDFPSHSTKCQPGHSSRVGPQKYLR
jgi:hypothetical protein